MKKTIAFIFVSIACLCFAQVENNGGYRISDVRAKNRAPWNPWWVDVDFTLTAPAGHENEFVEVGMVASNGTEEVLIEDGSFHAPLVKGDGSRHRFIWNAYKTYLRKSFQHLRFYLSVVSTNCPKAPYFTVNVSNGQRDWYPASFPKRVTAVFYKTSFVPFRYIPSTLSDEWKAISGGKDYFMMGSPPDEKYKSPLDAERESYVPIRITKGFWMGVYPISTGAYQSLGRQSPIDKNPDIAACGLTYDAIRGEDTLESGFMFGKDFDADGNPAVDPQKYIGRFRALTGLPADLPTEAQWEYVCRAGTTSAYWFPEENLFAPDWQVVQAPSRRTALGFRLANAWGIHDMVGCVHQWTTTIGNLKDQGPWIQVAADDPTGPVSDFNKPKRITRGSHMEAKGLPGVDTLGNPYNDISMRVYRSAYRYPQNTQNCEWNVCGFRLYIPDCPELSGQL